MKITVLTAVSGSIFSQTGCKKGRASDNENLPAEECGFTDQTAAGPFYLSNTAQSVNINYKNMPGKPMKISGTVYGDREGKKPLANARVEIWHADDSGHYHPEGNGDVTDYLSDEVNLRGIGYTNAQGHYAFESIVPGIYGARRRHIHWKVFANGYRSLTTQSYWLSEKGNSREQTDGTDRNTEDCRYVDFNENNGTWMGTFDIYLEPA